MTELLTFMFEADGDTPNNPVLPVIVYKAALDLGGSGDPEGEIERMFKANGWGRDLWRNGVYPFIHYHPDIHEALGVARGRAGIVLGGARGTTFDLSAGDVAILPAGTGHQRVTASDDFCMIGGYPPEGTYSLNRAGDRAHYDRALATVPRVPSPASDPVGGPTGALPKLWRRTATA